MLEDMTFSSFCRIVVELIQAGGKWYITFLYPQTY